MKNFVWILVFCGLCVESAPALAGFVWDGPSGAPAYGTAISVHFTDYEVALTPYNPASGVTEYSAQDILNRAIPGGAVTAPGDQIYSIFNVTSITNASGTQTYWTPNAALGQQLDGVIYGYTVSSITPGTSTQIQFTGGNMDIYLNSSNSYDATSGPFSPGWGGATPDSTTANSGVAASNHIGSAYGPLLLSLTAQPGANPLNPTVTLISSATALAAYNVVGSGDGYLSASGSLGGISFQKDGEDPTHSIPGSQDLFFKNSFTTASDSGPIGAYQENTNGWSLNSSDPNRGVAVPEPGTCTLLGVGFLALVARGRARIRSRRDRA